MALNKISISILVEEFNLICKKTENITIFPNLLNSIKQSLKINSEDDYKELMHLLSQIMQILNRLQIITDHSEILNNCLYICNSTKIFLNNEENIKLFNKFLSQISDLILKIHNNDQSNLQVNISFLNMVYN